jgi:cellulose biosynthesis protein BcsQ
MKIICVQSTAGGTGVSLQAAEIALKASNDGLRVLALDLCTQRQLSRDLTFGPFHMDGDCRNLFTRGWRPMWEFYPAKPHLALLAYPFSHGGNRSKAAEGGSSLHFTTMAVAFSDQWLRISKNLLYVVDDYDMLVIDVPNKDKFLMNLAHMMSDEVHVVRRQNIWHKSRRRLAESGSRQGVGFKRRAYGVASADIRWSVV